KCSPIIRPIQCMTSTKNNKQTIVRRSANYQPTIWTDDYVQSLRNPYKGEAYDILANELKEKVKIMLEEVVDPLEQLELVDTLQRTGLLYHFKDEVKKVLKSIYNDNHQQKFYATSIEFRLLIQHGYNVPQDVFNSFKDENGNIKGDHHDIMGMLFLYEASFLLVEFEDTMEDARAFATKHLEEYVKQNKDTYISILVSHALELPLHWRMPRAEVKWFIDIYETRNDMKPTLLELAKVDFNMVQATHQEDLRYASPWWRNTGLAEKLSFARDRLMESFLWSVGVISEPQFGYCRRVITKVIALATTIDDIYDVYGTLDELELFTNAAERWDINATEKLPDYMKICFLALYNSMNEIGFDALKGQGVFIVLHLKKAWTDLCKAYLLEAKWYYNKYTPTLQEYIDNSWISIAASVILVHAYSFVPNTITMGALQCLEKCPKNFQWPAMLLQLADDLGTSTIELDRGDVPKSIQCYMHESGVCEEDAREHIRYLIGETWKKMNAECVANSHFSDVFVEMAKNIGRMGFIYLHGDGHGAQASDLTKPFVVSLFTHPIP
ncbi:LOW QUALITY PROTEIN: Terpene_synth domain-containing protein/Terpene_synth_C domain-containing protein, partial [Cephalotus follicularis]